MRCNTLFSQKDFRVAISSVLVAIWAAFSLLVLDVALPFTSAYADVVPAYIIYFSFFCVFIVSYLFSLCFMGFSSAVAARHGMSAGLLQVINFSLFFSVLALCSLYVDRVFYRGVDFGEKNFVEIRDALNSSSDGSISSVFSVFGNLFQFSYFFSLIAILFYREYFSGGRFVFYFAVILICVFGGSYLLGGRAIFAVFLLTSFVVVMARVVAGYSSFRVFFTVRFLFLCGVAVALFFLIFVYVFYMRASVGGDSSVEYLNKFLLHLHGVSLASHESCGVGLYCDLRNYLYLSFLYFTHVFWVFAEIVSAPVLEPSGNPVFGAVISVFSRLFHFDVFDYRFAGLFNSMPGSLYYVWGMWGVWIGAALIGFFLAVAVFFLRFYNSFFAVLLFYVFYMALLVSPVLSVFNVMSFVFVVFCVFFYFFIFCLLDFLSRRV